MAETRRKQKIGKWIGKYFLLIATVFVALMFGLMNHRFLYPANLLNIVSTASLVGTMAFGAMVVMATGEMNFGIGAEATLTASLLGYLLHTRSVSVYVVAVLVSILAILLVACWDAAMAVYIGVPAFIATLAISKINDGFINILLSGKTLYSTNWPSEFTFIGSKYVGPIPVLAIAFLLIALSVWFLMDKTKLGRHIQAVGENPVACRQVGINVRRVKTTAFLICSLLAGIGGVLACSKTNNIQPTLGSGMMMDAMSAAMLGATFLRPGRFNVQGTVVAAILTAIISNGITFVGAPDFLKDVVTGTILIIAVGYIAMNRKDGLPSVKMG